MLWIGLTFAGLVMTLILVFSPLFVRGGNAPLPVGVESDARQALQDRRRLLLEQLQEYREQCRAGLAEPTVEGEQSTETRIEKDLAQIYADLDALKSAPKGQNNTVDNKPSKRLGAGDKISAVLMLSMVLLLSSGLYLFMGSPFPPPEATATQGHGRGDGKPPVSNQQIRQMVESLALRLKSEPDNIEGWMRLARSYHVMEERLPAIMAYTHILKRRPDNIQAALGLAGIQVESDKADDLRLGEVIYQEVLRRDGNNPEALWIMGSLAYQKQNWAKSRKLWGHLLTLIPEEDPAHRVVVKSLAEIDQHEKPPVNRPDARDASAKDSTPSGKSE